MAQTGYHTGASCGKS